MLLLIIKTQTIQKKNNFQKLHFFSFKWMDFIKKKITPVFEGYKHFSNYVDDLLAGDIQNNFKWNVKIGKAADHAIWN